MSPNKRVKSVTAKMSERDYQLLRKAATKLWPGAIVTDSAILLTFALREAERILKRKSKH